MAVTLKRADFARNHDVLFRFTVEYMEWAEANVRERLGTTVSEARGVPFAEAAENSVRTFCALEPPEGVFYLAEAHGSPVGMGGLRRSASGICEIKRMFVRPSARGKGVGSAIVERLIADARAFKNLELYLDGAKFMSSAHRLYEAAGFVERAPLSGIRDPGGLAPRLALHEVAARLGGGPLPLRLAEKLQHMAAVQLKLPPPRASPVIATENDIGMIVERLGLTVGDALAQIR